VIGWETKVGDETVSLCLNIVDQSGKKLSLSSSRGGGSTLEELAADSASVGQLVPAFVRTCVEYIEQEGLMSEGLYRVPGSRAHVDQLIETLRQGIYRCTVLHSEQHADDCCSLCNTVQKTIEEMYILNKLDTFKRHLKTHYFTSP